MGLFGYLRRRRERERAIPPGEPASPLRGVEATISEHSSDATNPIASAGRRPGLPTTLIDAFHYAKLARAAGGSDGAAESEEQKAIGDSVLRVMRERGIDPSSPDPARLMEPEVQRALRDAVLKHGPGGG